MSLRIYNLRDQANAIIYFKIMPKNWRKRKWIFMKWFFFIESWRWLNTVLTCTNVLNINCLAHRCPLSRKIIHFVSRSTQIYWVMLTKSPSSLLILSTVEKYLSSTEVITPQSCLEKKTCFRKICEQYRSYLKKNLWWCSVSSVWWFRWCERQ